VQADHYDFKGNLLISVRTYTQDATQHPNWGGTVAMETDTYTTAGTFDALNRPVTVTTPEGGITEYTYDKGGMLKTVTVDNVHSLDTGIVNNIEYDAKGQRQQVQYGNGTAMNYTYDPDTFRVTRIRTLRGTTVLQDLQYWYDPVGNITLQKDGAQQPVYFDGSVATPENDYTYDALYRLTGVSGRELAGNNNAPTYNDSSRMGITPIPIAATDTAKMRRYSETYTYDKAGNMLTQQHSVTGGTGNWTRTYTIAGGNNRLTGCSIGSNNPVAETYTHDGRGNIATGFNHLQSLAYNDANRLQQLIIDGNRTVYYQYDGAGQRVRKTVVNSSAHTTESRKYIGNFELYRNFDTSSLNINLERETLNVHDDTGRIALIDTRTAGTGTEPAQLLRYQYSNHLGTAALELDAAGAVISYEEYYPYGGTSFQSGRTAAEVSLKRYRYTGKERDEETGLYYHGARYYIPWLCRWAASDPLESKYAGMSPYNYGLDNPIKWQDSTGMGPDDPLPTTDTKKSQQPLSLTAVQMPVNAVDALKVTQHYHLPFAINEVSADLMMKGKGYSNMFFKSFEPVEMEKPYVELFNTFGEKNKTLKVVGKTLETTNNINTFYELVENKGNAMSAFVNSAGGLVAEATQSGTLGALGIGLLTAFTEKLAKDKSREMDLAFLEIKIKHGYKAVSNEINNTGLGTRLDIQAGFVSQKTIENIMEKGTVDLTKDDTHPIKYLSDHDSAPLDENQKPYPYLLIYSTAKSKTNVFFFIPTKK